MSSLRPSYVLLTSILRPCVLDVSSTQLRLSSMSDSLPDPTSLSPSILAPSRLRLASPSDPQILSPHSSHHTPVIILLSTVFRLQVGLPIPELQRFNAGLRQGCGAGAVRSRCHSPTATYPIPNTCTAEYEYGYPNAERMLKH